MNRVSFEYETSFLKPTKDFSELNELVVCQEF